MKKEQDDVSTLIFELAIGLDGFVGFRLFQ